MFQSPLKTVTEKLKPTQSKSSISSLKFERPSDFKKFIGFIKNETQELEKIKLPTRAEIEPKSKRGGFGGLLALGLFGGLGAAFGGGGEGEDEGNLRVGSAGGTDAQYLNRGVLLSKNIRRTKEVSKIRSAKTFEQRFNQQKRKKIVKRAKQLRIRRDTLRNFNVEEKIRQKSLSQKKTTTPTKMDVARERELIEELKRRRFKGEIFDDTLKSDLRDIDIYSKTGKFPGVNPEVDQLFLDFEEKIRNLDAKGAFKDTDKIVQDMDSGVNQRYTNKDFADAAERISRTESDITKTLNDIKNKLKEKRVPNLRIQSSGAMSLFGDKGFSIKDTLDKSFTFMGQKTKPLRNFFAPAAKNIAKAKVPFVPGNVSLLGISKGVGKIFPLVDAAGAVIAFNDLGLIDFSDGILKPKVGRDNIVTSLYDAFTAIYNTGVDIVGAGDANKRLFITKSRDKRIRAYDDDYNKKILEARRLKKVFEGNFDTGMVNNSNIQLPKSNIFAYQESNGAEFTIPFDYSNSGIFDYNAATFIKLFKQ